MFQFRSIIVKIAALLILVAALPLTIYGAMAVWQARAAAREAVLIGNTRVAERAADQIYQYVVGSMAILRSTAENISRADLEPWQRERVIRNMVLEFEEFDEIVVTAADGTIQAASGIGAPGIKDSPYWNAALSFAVVGEEYFSQVFITDEFVPAMIVSLPMKNLGEVTGVVAAEVDLIQMWRLVDSIKIGKHGYLSVILPGGRLIASGDGEMKRRVFQELDYPDGSLLASLVGESSGKPAVGERFNDGTELLVAATTLPPPFLWRVVMEQPTSEAFMLSMRLTRILTGLTALFVVAACLIGVFGARWQIVGPVKELIRGTRSIATGDLTKRVSLSSHDELGELASSFNRMAGELDQMQQNIRQQERMAFFGRIASGLVHDLKHPIRSVENASRLMEDKHDDPKYRETFRRVVDREFSKINVFLDNLYTLSHDIPYRPIDLALHPLLDEVVETFSVEAEKQGVEIQKEYMEGVPRIYADKFSMTRALSNLINNGIQAMSGGGRLTVRTCADESAKDVLIISIEDTGCGIPLDRIHTIFNDFTTTKHRGLGLGLALVKRIFDQHAATIDVRSEVDKGSVFEISMKRTV